jgi:hypothetical protein
MTITTPIHSPEYRSYKETKARFEFLLNEMVSAYCVLHGYVEEDAQTFYNEMYKDYEVIRDGS